MTATLKISPYVAYVASGSDISNPEVDSGYDHDLTVQLARIAPDGGNVYLTAAGLHDFAEFCEDLANAVAQDPNPSGARSLRKHAERALRLADRI